MMHDPKRRSDARPSLTEESALALYAKRKAMLASLRGDIPMSLQDSINAKIAFEYEYLAQRVVDREQEAEAQKILHAALRPEYFVQKRLDLTTL